MTTSARKENRWRKQLKQSADEEADRRRELEILSLARAPRAPTVPPPPNHTRRQVRAWMRRNAHEYETATQLAEAANATLRLPITLDEETHWIWDEAADAKG